MFSLWDRLSPEEVESAGSARKATSSSREPASQGEVVTGKFLAELSLKMREARDIELAQASGRQVAVNKRIARMATG